MDAPLNKQGRPTRKLKGITAELRVAVELLDNGFSVSWPFGDMEGYDLISDSKKRLTRLQVKSISTPTARGTYRVFFRKGHKTIGRYTLKDADFFVAVLSYPTGPAFYVIPVGTAPTSGVFFPPNQHPTEPDRRKTCKLEEYRNRWDLLR
jgi:hypothetical protein